MGEEYFDEEAGDWSGDDGWSPEDWSDSDGNDQYNGADTVQQGVFGGSTQSGGNDSWGGFWRGIGGAVAPLLSYGIQRDAAKRGLVPRRGPNGEMIYGRPGALTSGGTGLLLIGGLILGAVVLAKKG